MPLPKWLGRFNGRMLNPKAVEKGERPVITHVGRSSGRTYRTPLDAFPFDGGYIFFPLYGSDSDWVQNVLAAGEATLTVDDVEIGLTAPTLISRDKVVQLLASTVKPPAKFMNVVDYLKMDLKTR